MPINQPPIKEDVVESAWDFELTEFINRFEVRFNSLLEVIEQADDLDDLKEKVRSL